MVANPSPKADSTTALTARLGKKQKAKPKDLSAVSGIVWKALQRCQDLLGDEDKQIVLKASHAVFQGAAAYAKLHEIGELEARLEELEQAFKKNSKKEKGPHALRVGRLQMVRLKSVKHIIAGRLR
jgi:hypothetical protein